MRRNGVDGKLQLRSLPGNNEFVGRAMARSHRWRPATRAAHEVMSSLLAVFGDFNHTR